MSEPAASFFSSAQKRVIGFALGLGAFMASIALLAILVVALGRIIGSFSSVIWPLAAAGILAMILRPVVGLFERRLKLSRAFSTIVLYAVVTVAFVGFLLLFVPSLVRQLVDFINVAPELWGRAVAHVQTKYPEWSDLYARAMANDTLRQLIDGALDQVRNLALAVLPNLRSAGGTVLGAVGFFANLAIVPVYLFFFLQSDEEPTHSLHDNLPFLKDETRKDVVFLVSEFISIVVAFFRGQLVIGMIMGVLLAFGFWAVGLQFGFVLGLAIGLLNVIPYLGTILGLSAVLPMAYFQNEGGFVTVALCLGVFVLVQVIEGYVLTPRIMGKQTGLHPVAIIIAIFFWGTALDGILGMILAIPLTAFLVTAWRLAKRKYVRQLV